MTRAQALPSTPPTGAAPAAPVPDVAVAGARWIRAPIWFLALFTSAKSFVDNPIIGSPRLNRLGLHVWRMKMAHRLAGWRRSRLAKAVPAHLRQQFDRDGYVVLPDLLPSAEFEALRRDLFSQPLECRVHQQGDTVTRRVPFGPDERRRFPMLARLLDGRLWSGLMSYVASNRGRPVYYFQTIVGGVAEGPPDPQLQLHADTFHPSLKAFYFLTDVGEGDRPLTYVAGSHQLTPERIGWERRRSTDVLEAGDRLSQRGSLRITTEELKQLGLPAPTRFCVPANTLVVVDTCGFHARADAQGPSIRAELWAYSRRNPFLPTVGIGAWSWFPSAADARAALAYRLTDLLDRFGWRKQHWTPGAPRRLNQF